jgi:hypothetical protein
MFFFFFFLNKNYSLYRDFLPRGGSMVTKRPLVLQLVTSQGQGMSEQAG